MQRIQLAVLLGAITANLLGTAGTAARAAADSAPDTHRQRAAVQAAAGHLVQAIAELDRWIELEPDAANAFQMRGELHFRVGQVAASIKDFDRYLQLQPDRAPHHWQRGLSYYYAGQYQQGVRQFELHRRVNPQDVENAVWHYLCAARVDGVDRARAGLIEITGDNRPWAMPVYRMYQGRLSPQQVLQQAERAGRTEAERRDNLFYAQLYVGLWYEASGQSQPALEHIETAVQKYPSTHYMGDVARVHLQLRKAQRPDR